MDPNVPDDLPNAHPLSASDRTETGPSKSCAFGGEFSGFTIGGHTTPLNAPLLIPQTWQAGAITDPALVKPR